MVPVTYDKHVCIRLWIPSRARRRVHVQIKEAVSSHKWDFLGRTLMIHLSRWSTGEQGTQRQNTEQSARTGLSLKGTNRSDVPHAAIQTQHHSGERNKQNEKAIEILKSHAHMHLFFWLWYGTVTSCCLKFNEIHLGIKMKRRKCKSQRKIENYTESLSNTRVPLTFGGSFMMSIWCAYKYTVRVCVWQAVMKQKHNLNALMFSLQSNTQRCAGRGEREMKDRKSIWEIWEQISDGCLCVCVRVCVCKCVCVC